MKIILSTTIAALLCVACGSKAPKNQDAAADSQTHTDTLQYLYEQENEDNLCSVFLSKNMDSISIVILDGNRPTEADVDKMYLAQWRNEITTAAGDTAVKYEQAYMVSYHEVSAKPYSKSVTEEQILQDISAFPEVKSYAQDLLIAEQPAAATPYYVVQAGNRNEGHFTPLYWFYVYLHPRYEIKYYDLANEEIVSLDEWRNGRKKEREEALTGSHFKKFSIYSVADTIRADFNGDKIIDLAFFADDGDYVVGMYVVDGKTKKRLRVGADKSFEGMADDFSWVSFWATTDDRETFEIIIEDGELTGERKAQLEHTSIVVRKDESGGGVVTFKNNTYVWVHQND